MFKMNQVDHKIWVNIIHITSKDYPKMLVGIEKEFNLEEKNEFLEFTNDVCSIIKNLKKK